MIRKEIEKILCDAAKKQNIDSEFCVTFSALPSLCDFQCNSCFVLAKKLGKNPFDVANQIVGSVESNKFYHFSVARPAFINISLTQQGLKHMAECLLNANYNFAQGKKIFLDYGGPNIGKAMHIGHMRSFNIGEAFKRLYKKLGFKVVCDIFLGDWGMPMGLIMAMLEKEGTLEKYMSGQMPLTLDVMNRAYPKASLLKGEDENFKQRAESLTLAFQNKQQPYFDFWKKLRDVSVTEIKKVCKLLNVDFDLWNGESNASEYIPTILKIFEEKGLSRISEGALVVDVAEEGEQFPIPKKTPDEVQRYENPMPPLMLKKSNGGDKYETSDIVTIYFRNKEYNPDILHYFTDARQNQRFVQIFRACKKAGISPEGQLLWHTGFGTINGKDGKALKTRDGGNMQLNDLLNMLYEKAEQKLVENGTAHDDDLKRKIGNAALKFADLSNSVEKDYNFDIDRVLSFEGKTGPYIQYTACRIKSILAKAPKFEENYNFSSEYHKNVLIALNRLSASYKICFEAKSLNDLCASLYDVASAFSSFYNAYHILSEQDKSLQSAHLTLLKMVLKFIEEGCYVLGIEVPEKM